MDNAYSEETLTPAFIEKYRLIRAHRNPGCVVTLWGVSEGGIKNSFDLEHRPYFYVALEDSANDPAFTGTEFGYQDIAGEPLRKVCCTNPSDVPRLREMFSKTWESDIPFARRTLIDWKITSGFDPEFNPVQCDAPLARVYLDIEVTPREKTMPDSSQDEVNCLTLSDGRQTVSVMLDNPAGATREDESTAVLRVSSEKQLLEFTADLLQEWQGAMLVGWNVDFDVEYLQARAKVKNVDFSVLDSYSVFDLLGTYRALYRRRGYRLKDIAVDEGFSPVAENINYKQLWDTDRPAFLRMNQQHTRWLHQIDSKLRVTDYYWDLKETAGLEDCKDLYSSVIIDTMLLRRAAGRWVLPSKQKQQHKGFEGALVLTPPSEVVDNVAVFDLSRFYPSIILSEKLCPVILAEYKKNHDKIDWVEYQKFAAEYKGETLLLDYVREMIALREKFTREGYKDRLAAVKGLLNSAFGVMAYPGFRLYTPEIPQRITETARNVISALGKEVQDWGYRLVAGDTDSIFVVCGSEPKEMEIRLNEALKKYGDYTIKLDHNFRRCLFVGLKKKYAGINSDGSLHITGFERVRTDASNYTKEVQEKILRLILEGKTVEIMPYLKDKVKNIRSTSIADIAISKTLSKDLQDYSGSQQNYILAAKGGELDLKQGDFIKMVPARNYPSGMAVFQDVSDLKKMPMIDWDAIVDKQIKAKVEDLLPLVGLDWSMVKGQGRLL